MFRLFIAIIIFSAINLFSQNTEEITLNDNQVWFSLNNGVAGTAAQDNWDIAFQKQGPQDASILLNGGSGLKLYFVDNLLASQWDQEIDPSNKDQWTEYYNSNETWNIGAFNMGKDGFGADAGDYGWGAYNMGTHSIVGNSIFLVEFPNGTYKKILIEVRLSGAKYRFKYADPDGTNEVSEEIDLGKYPNVNFVYYSLQNGEVVNREPNFSDWDITFTRYMAAIPVQTGVMYYGVLGVKNNFTVGVVEINDTDYETVAEPNADAYSDVITEIGYDWKDITNTDPAEYSIVPGRVYFIRDVIGDVHKLQFVEYVSNDNTVRFRKSNVTSVSDTELEKSLILYPSVAERNGKLNVIFNSENPVSSGKIVITNTLGNTVYSENISGLGSFDSSTIDLEDISSGMYLLNYQSGNQIITKKFIIR